MKIDIKKILLNNAPLKVISFILGFTLWYTFSQSNMTEFWITVPLCFHSTPESYQIEAPENVSIKLAGKRSDLYAIDTNNLAIYINTQNLSTGINTLTLTNRDLFLPDTIKLINYRPTPITIKIHEEPEITKNA